MDAKTNKPRAVLGSVKDVAFRNAKPNPGGKVNKVAAGEGLYLFVSSADSKLWRLLYRWQGKQQTFALGSYPAVSAAEAVTKARDAKRQLSEGINPAHTRKLAKAAGREAAANSFQAVALEWIAKHGADWSASHTAKVQSCLKNDLFPWLGKRPIGEIEPPELRDCLTRILDRGATDTPRRARQIASLIFRYAIATSRATRDPAADLRGMLPKRAQRHFPTLLDPTQIGGLLRAMRGYSGTFTVRVALHLAPLLLVRPGELRCMDWREVNLETAEWRIPAGRMKMRQEHIVPLPVQAVAQLRELHPLTGGEQPSRPDSPHYVFPCEGNRLRPMSENTVNAALRRMGYDTKTQITGHGFRAMARSLLAELGWKPDAIERQLAHKPAGPLGAAYDRAQFTTERKLMMQAWADYLDALARGDAAGAPKVVALKRA